MSADGAKAQVFTPPNTLKSKLGGRLKSFDADAIKRAEAALAGMANQFGDWLNDELAKLEASHKIMLENGSGDKEVEQFYRHAHELKGLGTTYGFPIVSQFAGSLCRLIDSPDGRAKAPKALLSRGFGQRPKYNRICNYFGRFIGPANSYLNEKS